MALARRLILFVTGRRPQTRSPTKSFWEPALTLEEFELQNRGRLKAFCRTQCAKMHLPPDMREDLYQICMLVAHDKLPSWRPDGGKSAFNWVMPNLHRYMCVEYRLYHGFTRFAADKHVFDSFMTSLGDREPVAPHIDQDLQMDIEAKLAQREQNEYLEHFLLKAVHSKSGGEIAETCEKTRQAVNDMNRVVRDSLAKQLADLEYDRICKIGASQPRIAYLHQWTDTFSDPV